MKSILLSVQPKWVQKILSGEKTIEVRKSAPKEVPFRVYVYETKGKVKYKEKAFVPKPYGNDTLQWFYAYEGRGEVVAEFVCMNVETFNVGSLRCDDIEKLACLTHKEMVNYFYKPIELDGNTQKWGKALHISDLKIYDEPLELGEFCVFCKDFLKCEDVFCNKDTCRRGVYTDNPSPTKLDVL